MSRASKRFTPSRWAGYLVPVLLALLLLGLVVTIIIVALSLLGMTPSF